MSIYVKKKLHSCIIIIHCLWYCKSEFTVRDQHNSPHDAVSSLCTCSSAEEINKEEAFWCNSVGMFDSILWGHLFQATNWRNIFLLAHHLGEDISSAANGVLLVSKCCFVSFMTSLTRNLDGALIEAYSRLLAVELGLFLPPALLKCESHVILCSQRAGCQPRRTSAQRPWVPPGCCLTLLLIGP